MTWASVLVPSLLNSCAQEAAGTAEELGLRGSQTGIAKGQRRCSCRITSLLARPGLAPSNGAATLRCCNPAQRPKALLDAD